jgi:putative membrane protein
MKRWSFGVILAWAAAACPAVDGEPQAPPTAPAAARPAIFAAASARYVKTLTPEQREEWRFLKVATANGRFELDASRLALARSDDSRVLALARSLVDRHITTLPQLRRMLGERSMAPPMLSNEQRRSLTRLGKLRGARFDREWMAAVGVRSLQEAVAAYEKAAQSAGDPALRSWAEETLPILRGQLKTVTGLNSR